MQWRAIMMINKRNIALGFLAAFTTVAIAQNTVTISSQGGYENYQTDKVRSIAISDDNVVVTPNEGTARTIGNVRNINFRKMESDKVSIIEAKGWQESAYVKFGLVEGADNYNVYVRGVDYTDYTKIDNELVRNYGTYGRADVPGLKVGSYTLKVVPVAGGSEIETKASETTELTVVAFDRSGFAHKGWTKGVGAYNNDGTLKDGAKVVYVTKDNFNTVTLSMVTTKKGATTECVGLGNILAAKEKGYDTTPIDVRIVGCITASDASAEQRKSDQDGLQVKGKTTDFDFAITIEGVGDDAVFNGFGLGIVRGSGIEVRNMAFMNQGSSDDNMEIKGTQHVWVHNNDYFYGQQGGGDHGKGDGSLDVKDKCSYGTFAYNRFHDSGKAMLCGMKSEVTDNLLAYHHNWFDHADSRMPRVRTSTVHVWNNYYDGVSKYGIGATTGSSIFAESNYFRGTKRPIMSSGQGTDATGEGTFSGETGGIVKSYGNYYDSNISGFSLYTQNNPNATTGIDTYEASTRDEQVPASVTTKSGGTTYNNFDTNNDIMYTYTPDPAEDVPSIVTGYYGAGRLNHGDIDYTIDNKYDSDYGRLAGLDAVLSSYQTTLVGWF